MLEGLNRGLPKLGIGRNRGLDQNHNKDVKKANGTRSIESKQCGSMDFWGCLLDFWLYTIFIDASGVSNFPDTAIWAPHVSLDFLLHQSPTFVADTWREKWTTVSG